MNYESSVKIGPDFFKKAFNDYRDPHWAFVREIMQNSLDAGSSNININVRYNSSDSTTIVEVSDDGCGMTDDVLFNKLLSLGSSGKDFNGVGGFGKAKEILYFAHVRYEIHTSTTVVKGSGGSYTTSHSNKRCGVRSVTVWEKDVTNTLIRNFSTFTRLLQDTKLTTSSSRKPCHVSINGTEITQRTNVNANKPKNTIIGFGSIYTSPSSANVCLVRVDGMPMFLYGIKYKSMLIIELESSKLLTSNRDGMAYSSYEIFNNIVSNISTNARKVLQREFRDYTVYEGSEISVNVNKQRTSSVMKNALGEIPTNSAGSAINANVRINNLNPNASAEVLGESVAAKVQSSNINATGDNNLAFKFVIKNTTGMACPSYYQPASSDFCTYAMTLAIYWTQLLVKLHEIFSVDVQFAVGFVFDENSEAEFDHGTVGRLFLINPAIVVLQGNSNSRSFKKRFKLTERYRLLSLAVHEFVHGLGYTDHDEAYSAKLTDVFAVVMSQLREFNKCFSVNA